MVFRLDIPDAKLSEAVTLLADGLNPRAIILFGSRARGTNRPDSDYDLLVLSERPVRTSTPGTCRIACGVHGMP